MLGAGASVGALGGNDRPLPTGMELTEALVEDFGIDTGGETISLARAYDNLQRNKPKELAKYLKLWFQNCQPTWQNLLADFNWQQIWTFNIDDILEQAYYKEGRASISLTWDQRFSERDSSNAQQIIHLHGLAGRLQEEGNNEDVLVFSASEYARAIAHPRTWNAVFSDKFADHPFLVIGANLVDELDIAPVLENGTAAGHLTGYPSVLVVPTITPVRREQLEAAGLTIIESNGEDFIRKLLEYYRDARNAFDEVYGKSTPGMRRFQQQFIDLRKFKPLHQNDGTSIVVISLLGTR